MYCRGALYWQGKTDKIVGTRLSGASLLSGREEVYIIIHSQKEMEITYQRGYINIEIERL